MHLKELQDGGLRQGGSCMYECRSGSGLRRQEGECMGLQQLRVSMSIQMVSPLSCQRQRHGSAPQAMEHLRQAMARLVRPRLDSIPVLVECVHFMQP